MSIADKLQTIADNQEVVYNAGAYSVFEKMTSGNWLFQQNHNKELFNTFMTSDLSNMKVAQYVFHSNSWIEEFDFLTNPTFKPTTIHYLFQNCETIKRVLGLDYQINVFTGVFDGCSALEDVGTLDFTKTTHINKCFQNCSSLKEIRVNGTIKVSIDLQHSPLSKDSISSVVNALLNTASGNTATFNKAAVNAAFTDAEWSALVATKPNWTIALV